MYTLYPANERWWSDHGWLKSNFSFSFADYYNPKIMWFWTLRVINNDIVQAGRGFWEHPHDNMEIITLALSWSLTHRDSMGNEETLIPGEVQSMSAWTWVVHSEMNEWNEDWEFFQIWIETKNRNIAPQYSQKKFSEDWRKNTFQLLAWPTEWENVLINQNSHISRIVLEKWTSQKYKKYNEDNGLYIMSIYWDCMIAWESLWQRDAIWITQEDSILFESLYWSDILIIEVPMK